jgi:hypothetical protein
MTTIEKKIPSWIRNSDSDDESIANRQQLKEEQIQLQQEPMSTHTSNEIEHRITRNFQVKHVDDDDEDDDDEEDDTNRPSILPTNLQIRESNMQNSTTKRGGGLFRRGRRNETGSITTDHPQNENEDIGSVASYMKGFSGNTVHSSATALSILSTLSRFLPFGFNRHVTNDNNSKKETEKKISRPPLPPKKPLLAPSKKDTGTSKKSQRRPPGIPPRPPQHQTGGTTSMQEQAPEATVHSSIPDPTPTFKSISTMDTEECTFEGGVPAVIYCFIKVNPYENDDIEDDWNNSGGIRSFLPSAIAKRIPKRKQPKTFIDEDDEESYFQTLVAL